MLGQMLDERQLDKRKIVRLEKQNALLLQGLFGRKSEETAMRQPQLALFNEVERVIEPLNKLSEEEVVAQTKPLSKLKPLPADPPRNEIIYELPEDELTCDCVCRKHTIGEEVSEQL